MRRLALLLCATAMAVWVLGNQGLQGAQATRGATAVAALPVMVIDTVKGTIQIQLFQNDAPKSVAHILALVNKSFYRAQRFHRAEPTLVQFGDPQSRDMTRIDSWGTGSSYNPIGVAEISKRKHVRGAVGLAHSGNATLADSQLYIMKAASPSLDGKHAIIGQVIAGLAVVDQIAKGDQIKLVTMKVAGQK
jgi:cyclophilin family peptidyl-prolyl cis-trans isomerase